MLVCSARSGNTKETGTTNLLIQASLQALRPSNPSPSSSRAQTPSVQTPGINPLSLSMTSQQFQRSGSSSVLPSLANGSSWYSRSNSPMPLTPRRSMSSSVSSLRDEYQSPTPQAFENTVEQIRNDHIKAARQVVRDESILEQLEGEIDYDCDQLRSFLMAAQILEEISPRSKDTIIGVGERLSCRIVSAVLRDRVRHIFGPDSAMLMLKVTRALSRSWSRSRA